jgi:hypothetical protein
MKTQVWSKATFGGWVVAIRDHRLTGVIGFGAGLLDFELVSFLDRVSVNRHSVLSRPPALFLQNPVLIGILGLAVLIWLMGSLEHPRKRFAVFIFSFFGGVALASLMTAVVRTLAGDSM